MSRSSANQGGAAVSRDKTGTEYSPEFIQKLIKDVSELSEQVKRLVKTEYALYSTQEELDKQIVLYRGLYEIGKRLTTFTRIRQILSVMGDYIIEQLNYGGYALFERDNKSLSMIQSDGACSARRITKRDFTLTWMKETIEAIESVNEDCIVTMDTEGTAGIQAARDKLNLVEFVIYPFYIGRKKTPAYYLVVGNPAEKAFYTSVARDDISMIGLNNLASLIENALNNVVHYQQLATERKLLEIKVDERTRDLNDAMENLKRLNAKLEHISFTDELTGLYNRRGFQIFGEKYFTMARRKGNAILVLYSDLDRFKPINDRFGHNEGDSALRATARILSDTFRDYDIISRFGGDEFVVLLDNMSGADIASIRQRLDDNLDSYNRRSRKKYKIEISCGFSAYNPSVAPDVSLKTLIAEADRMLLAEKAKKRSG